MQENIEYQTNKEDDDFYSDIEVTSNFNSINILDIQICEANLNQSIENIKHTIESKKIHQFLFVNTLQLLKFRRNKKLKETIKEQSSIFATDSLICWASRKLSSKSPDIISPTLFLLKLLGLCEKRNFSLFILGKSESQVDKFYYNIIRNFPELIIMGRQGNFLNKKKEKLIREAIKKTAPDIILLANSFPKQNLWIHKYKSSFEKSSIVYLGETFDLFAGKTECYPSFFKKRGLKWLWNFIIFPINIKRFFNIIIFFLIVFFKSIFKKSK